MKLADLAARDRRIEAGAWVGDLPYLPGISLRTRGIESSVYIRLNAKLRPPAKAGEPERTEEENTQIQSQLISEALLTGWHGIEDEFTPENVAAACELSTFRSAAFYAATIVAHDGRDEVQALEKNSSTPSDGQSSGESSAPTTPRSKSKG